MLPLFSYCCHCMLCVQGDCSVVEKKVAHCQLMRLTLLGDSTLLLPALSGVKDNCSIIHLEVGGEPITICMPLTILYHIGVCIYIYTCMHGWGPCIHVHTLEALPLPSLTYSWTAIFAQILQMTFAQAGSKQRWRSGYARLAPPLTTLTPSKCFSYV